MSKTRKAFLISCELLNCANIYGIDSDKLFELVMGEKGVVSGFTLAEWILRNIDRFSDNDRLRNRAIKRIGF